MVETKVPTTFSYVQNGNTTMVSWWHWYTIYGRSFP